MANTPQSSKIKVCLLSLYEFLATYLLLHAPPNAPWLPRDFRPLARVSARILLQASYVATLLRVALPCFLTTAARQRKRRKAACGGKAHPNLFRMKDLQQEPVAQAVLEAESSAELCLRLGAELRLLFRLIRASQNAFWRRLKRWPDYHRAVVIVARRLMQINAELSRRGTRFFAEQCMREQLRLLWVELFGPNVPPTSGVWRCLCQREDVPPTIQGQMLWVLLQERAQGAAVPAPFQETLIAAWERGELEPLEPRRAPRLLSKALH
jgi:hypothetical protein